jgi:hypothetical protein
MVLAIEADGASYRQSGSVRDRDRLRGEHLQRLGWNFHRLWSTNWFHDPDSEVAKVRAAYDSAVAASAPPPPQPAADEHAGDHSAAGRAPGPAAEPATSPEPAGQPAHSPSGSQPPVSRPAVDARTAGVPAAVGTRRTSAIAPPPPRPRAALPSLASQAAEDDQR